MKSLWKASFVMASGTLISRMLGLVREQVMAYAFGASFVTDAFLVAYRIPNLLRDLFAEGAFSAAFVPTFTEVMLDRKERARALLWQVFWRLLAITGVISVLFIIFAPELVGLFAPSYKEQPERFHLAVDLTRIMAPYFALVSMGALMMGVLNALKVFFIPSLASACFNVAFIASVLLIAVIPGKEASSGIYAAAIGVLIGGLGQFLFQFPQVIKRGYGPIRSKEGVDPKVKAVFVKLGPGVLGFAATQINLIVNTILATGTVVGAVSWLSYAFRLFQFPVGVLGVSVGNSNLVLFSQYWKAGEREKATTVLKASYETTWLILIPASVLLYMFAEQGIHLVFERGAFNSESTLMTAKALRWYTLGLVFYGIYKVWGPTFYALEKPRIPVIASVGSIVLNIIFCLSLVDQYGFQVLSFGTSLSMFVNVLIQTWFLRRELALESSFFISKRILKVLLLNGLMIAATQFLILPFVFEADQSLIIKCLNLLGCGVSFVFLYAIGLFVLGEADGLKKFLSRIQKRT